MNVSYKREMRHNYLILEAMEKEEENFEIRMLTGNSIEGLLKFRVKQEEQASYYYYEITSKQPLSRLLEFKEIKKEELSTLIMEIGAVLKRIEDYLLSESNLFLEPEHIYIEPESYQVWLCYVPGYEKSFPKAMEKLLQYLLKKTDHKDNDTVVLAYRLYQESQKDYYGIEDLLRIVRESQQGKLRENSGGFKRKEEEDRQNEGRISDEERQKNPKNKDEYSWEEEEKEHGLKEENPGSQKRKASRNVFAICIGILILGPLFVWLYAGMAGLRQYGEALLIMDIGAGLGIFAYLWKIKRAYSGEKEKRRYFGEKEKRRYFGEKEKRRYFGENEEKRAGKEKEWQMTFDKDELYREDAEEEKGAGEVLKESNSWKDSEGGEYREYKENQEREAENTVLLAEVSQENEKLHLLKSVNPSINDIAVPYFPFIIGKQEGIVDYVLKRDTISRIHLRIDEGEGGCKVTDLNSSNGTAVGDYRLEANESCFLCSGDKLTIADISFIFY